MKVKLEAIQPDADSSFKILLTPNLNDLFYWHFHPEYEIVYVEAGSGIRHIGDHISRYEESDLALIGPNIPHLNFDYGVKTTVETVVVQMKEHFLGEAFFALPEIAAINDLFERARTGLAFYGETKKLAGELLKTLTNLSHFDQLIALLKVFQLLAESKEFISLDTRPIAKASVLKEQKRLHRIYHYIESHYQDPIDVNEVAKLSNLTTAAFCRYFKKSTHLTFTDFLNQYRINQAKKLLLQEKSITEACYESGFEHLSYFNKTFRKYTGMNPSAFRKMQTA
ncbi:AraC family transcriptional regulator [Flavihumibacter rivuli]|uniref:helix-turn-helix transcriptional regulator n=1 Tax=Flavihumibacter rivuli TaxID=2838156 RepID=UPI001BDF4611|nr:AraC family transcriptional regulator [Flavihumibacter rivuli]ULQ55675.1 AraC family transcriptional regulator [Flavihumibacter rivuli]